MTRVARNFYIGPMAVFDYVYGHDFEKPELWEGMKARTTNISLGFSYSMIHGISSQMPIVAIT